MCYKNEQSHIKLGYSSIRTLYACENDPFLRSLRQIQIITYWCGHLKETPVSAVTIWLECSAAGKGSQVSEGSQWHPELTQRRSGSKCECLWILGISSDLEHLWTLEIPSYICISCTCVTFRKPHLLPKYEAIHSTTQCWRVKNSEFIKNTSLHICYNCHTMQHLKWVV